MRIERISLRGRRVLLEPLTTGHLPGLGSAIRDGEPWKIPVTLVPHPDDLGEFLSVAYSHFMKIGNDGRTMNVESKS